MKTILLLSIELIVAYSDIFCQCAQPGLKIMSEDCEPPTIKVATVSVSSIMLKWKIKKNQRNIIKATGTDPATNQVSELEVSYNLCGAQGNCAATIHVKEGTKVSWSVQSTCSNKGVILYSAELKGKEIQIPVTEKLANGSVATFHVYPNPSTGYLTVEYESKVTGNIDFKIFDIAGKMMFRKPGNAVVKTGNSYQLDLHNFISGTYLLELRNGGDVSKAKFVLFRK